MKKFLVIILLIVLSIYLVSCTSGTEIDEKDKKKMEERRAQIHNSENLIKEYLELSMQGRYDDAKKLIKKDKQNDKTFDFDSSTKLVGYNIKDVEKVGESIEATVELMVSAKEDPYYSVNNLVYSLEEESKNKKIEISNVEEREGLVFFQDLIQDEPTFMIGEGKSAKGKSMFTLRDLPPYISVKTNHIQEEKVKVSDNSFGTAAISGEGRQMIITSVKDGNTLLMMVEKSIKVFNNDEDKEVNNDSSVQVNGQDSKDKIEVQVDGIDYFENSIVEHIAFSPSGKVIFAQIKSGDKIGLSIYSASSKKIISPKIMEKFNSLEYTITNAYFNNENSLILQVENLKDKKPESYVLDVLNDNIIKQDQ